jgi:hypothetical protein
MNKQYRLSTTVNGVESDMQWRVGRRLEWPERMLARLAAGTLARINAARRPGEAATAFVRTAIEREIARREKAGLRQRQKD